MQKLPLFIQGSFYDNGRSMTQAEARKIARSVFGPDADVVQAERVANGQYLKEWRVIR